MRTNCVLPEHPESVQRERLERAAEAGVELGLLFAVGIIIDHLDDLDAPLEDLEPEVDHCDAWDDDPTLTYVCASERIPNSTDDAHLSPAFDYADDPEVEQLHAGNTIIASTVRRVREVVE